MSKTWSGTSELPPKPYICGYCGKHTGPKEGFIYTHNSNIKLYICTNCDKPTFFDYTKQYPGPIYGTEIEHLPKGVEELYNQARDCMASGAYTSAVLTCRKILLHIAHAQGATDKQASNPFSAIEYLAEKGYVPPNSKDWVHHIRLKGNEANHEIVIMTRQEAQLLLNFLEMLLRFIYEFPAKITPPATP